MVFTLGSALLVCGMGCNQDTGKTREEAADAAARLRKEGKKAAHELKKDAEEARKQGTAIAQGAREGWNAQDSTQDLNSASKEQLMALPGVDAKAADRIIARRPYREKTEVASKGAIAEDEYRRIQDRIAVR